MINFIGRQSSLARPRKGWAQAGTGENKKVWDCKLREKGKERKRRKWESGKGGVKKYRARGRSLTSYVWDKNWEHEEIIWNHSTIYSRIWQWTRWGGTIGDHNQISLIVTFFIYFSDFYLISSMHLLYIRIIYSPLHFDDFWQGI